jgi:hypothetical protein
MNDHNGFWKIFEETGDPMGYLMCVKLEQASRKKNDRTHSGTGAKLRDQHQKASGEKPPTWGA